MQFENNEVEIRPYTHKELASLYTTTGRTLNTWMDKFRDELGDRAGHYYSIKQVKIIFRHLDVPCKIKDGAN